MFGYCSQSWKYLSIRKKLAQKLQNASTSNKSNTTEVLASTSVKVSLGIGEMVEVTDRGAVINSAALAGIDLSLLDSITVNVVVNIKPISVKIIIYYATETIWKGTFKYFAVFQVQYITNHLIASHTNRLHKHEMYQKQKYFPSDLMKSTVVDESLSSFKPMYCSREYQASTRLSQQYEKSTSNHRQDFTWQTTWLHQVYGQLYLLDIYQLQMAPVLCDAMQKTWEMVKPCKPLRCESVGKVTDVVPPGASIWHQFDSVKQACLPICTPFW